MNRVFLLESGEKPHNGDYVEVERFLRLTNTMDPLARREQSVTEVVVVRPRQTEIKVQVDVAEGVDPEQVEKTVKKEARRGNKG